jgi:Alkylmercury lyase
MLLFRSEDSVGHWCARHTTPRGEVLTMPTLWRLAQRWYGNRMSADYRGRSLAEAEAVFADVGLVAPFWKA